MRKPSINWIICSTLFVYVQGKVLVESGCYGPADTVCTRHFIACPPTQSILLLNIKLYGRGEFVEQEYCTKLTNDQCRTSPCCTVQPRGTISKIVLPPLIYGQCSGYNSCNVTSPYTDMLPSFGYVRYRYLCIGEEKWVFIAKKSSGEIGIQKNFIYSGLRGPNSRLNCSCEAGDSEGELFQAYIHLDNDSCKRVTITINGTSLFNCSTAGIRIYKNYILAVGKMTVTFNDLSAKPNELIWMTYKGKGQFSCTGCSHGSNGHRIRASSSPIHVQTPIDLTTELTPSTMMQPVTNKYEDFTKDIMLTMMTLISTAGFLTTCLLLVFRTRYSESKLQEPISTSTAKS